MNPQTRHANLEVYYQRYLTDHDSAKFIKQVATEYTIGTLERLAMGGQRNGRRAATMAIGFLGDYASNAVLGQRLTDVDRGVRILAENGIRELWYRDGNEAQRQSLAVIVRLNNSGQPAAAERQASALLDAAPGFAEVWNQRAAARFQRRGFSGSIRDCHQTLKLNPYHFAAAVGMGQCYLELDRPLAALESFRRSLLLCPGMEEVRAQVIYLEKALEGN